MFMSSVSHRYSQIPTNIFLCQIVADSGSVVLRVPVCFPALLVVWSVETMMGLSLTAGTSIQSVLCVTFLTKSTVQMDTQPTPNTPQTLHNPHTQQIQQQLMVQDIVKVMVIVME